MFCLEAIKVCKLDRVLLLPEEHPRHKANVASIEHRIAMLEIATQKCSQLEVVRLHSDRFTVRDTLPEIYACTRNATLTMLLGSDVVTHMERWPDINDLLATISLAIGLRGTESVESVSEIIRSLRPENSSSSLTQVQYIHTPHTHAASSRVRESLGQDSDIDPSVMAYALHHALYIQPA